MRLSKFLLLHEAQKTKPRQHHLNDLRNIDKNILYTYIKHVTKWLFGNTQSTTVNLINTIQQDSNLKNTLAKIFIEYNSNNSDVTIYRSICLDREQLQKMPEFKNYKVGAKYNMNSRSKQDVASWTTNKKFAMQWHPYGKDIAQQFVFKIDRCPINDYVIYMNDVFVELYMDNMSFIQDILYEEDPKAYAVGMDVDEFFDAVAYYTDQHEVVVWHNNAIESELIYKKHY